METNLNLVQSLAKVQGKLQDPALEAENPYFKSKYAPLNAFLSALRKTCAEFGVFLTQDIDLSEDGTAVMVTKVYKDAETLELFHYPLVLSTKPQEVGSAITYARRYSLMSAFGLVGDEDDDGNAASKPQATAKAKPAKQAAKLKKYSHDLTRLTEMKEDLAARANIAEREAGKALMAFANGKALSAMDDKEFNAFLKKAEDFYKQQVAELDGTDEPIIAEVSEQ